MIPLQRISTRAVIPTTIVTSPGFQVRLWPRAMIHERMKGAAQASTSSTSRLPNTCQAFAESPSRAPAIVEFGFWSLVVNHGSQSETNSTTAAPMPRYSPGDSRVRSR